MLKNWLTVVFKISAASGIDLEYSLFYFVIYSYSRVRTFERRYWYFIPDESLTIARV